jgi:hypothetical protein
MGKQEVPKPLLLVLVAVALGAGAFFVLGRGGGGEAPPPPPPTTQATGPTGQTGGDGQTTQTGPTGGDKPEEPEITAQERRQKLIDAANKAGMPLDVYLAIKRGKKVLIFFWEPNGKVDQRVDDSIKAVKAGDKKVVVFRDKISNRSRYDGIAEAATITGTPGIVIIYRDSAGSIVGYVEAGALRERIAQIVNP